MPAVRPTTRQIRAELAARIGAIGAASATRPSRDLAVEIDQIRQVAHHHGLYAAIAVTHALESALAHGARGALVQGLLAILRDAVGCERQDSAACETFAAVCSVRLAA